MFALLAQAASAPAAAPVAGAQGSPFAMFVPMILVFAVFYFLLIRPQQKQQKKLAQLISAAKAGDDIIMRSGIHGKIISTANDAGTCVVEIAKGVQVTVSKDQIAVVKNSDTNALPTGKNKAA